MYKLSPLLLISLLAACGMKGDLVLPDAAPVPATPGDNRPSADASPAETPEEEARRQGVNPPSADPDLTTP